MCKGPYQTRLSKPMIACIRISNLKAKSIFDLGRLLRAANPANIF
jgi:hypothetical protein